MLVSKPHAWLEINKSSFDHNISLYRTLIGSTTKLSVVLKSNATGHGIKEIGMLCEKNKDVDWLCAASLSEALKLRYHGITKPILVLSIVDDDPALAIMHDIDLPIFDLHAAHIINNIALALNKQCAIHIKIDTGLSRFGFNLQEAPNAIFEIISLRGLITRGIYTHCAESGNTDQSFTFKQLESFNALIKELEKNGIHIPLQHAANSAAVSTLQNLFPSCNLVRIGAGAYGLWHFKDGQNHHPDLQLKQVMSWKTHISYIKKVPAQVTIGYDRTYQTTRETTIATIPVGYHDGYDRRFSNVGLMRIHDFYARVIGRICMNATMLEIPEGKEVKIGDQVILLGDYEHIRAHELAALICSYNAREITTRLSDYLERRIIQEIADQPTRSTVILKNQLKQST